MKRFRHFLFRLPVVLGASTLLGFGARATVTDEPKDNNEAVNSVKAGEVIVKLDNGQIYFSQDAGGTFERLELSDSPETARLRQLLGQGDRSAVKVSPTVVADGAGGLQWARPRPAATPDTANGTMHAAAPPTQAVDDKARTNAGPKGPPQTKPE